MPIACYDFSMESESIKKLLTRALKNKHPGCSIELRNASALAGIANLNHQALGADFAKKKFDDIDSDCIGFNPVCVRYLCDDIEHSFNCVIKGHEPGAFVSNLCPDTLALAGIELGKPYHNSFIANEFKYLSDGEYHFYPLLQQEAPNCAYVPKYYGRYFDYNSQRNYVVIELLQSITHLNQWQLADSWPKCYYEAAIDGLAALHAVFLSRDSDPTLNHDWLVGPFTTHAFKSDRAIWQQLFARMAEYYPDWTPRNNHALQDYWIESIDTWWQHAYQDCPKTIIHGDFNPRNFGFTHQTNGQPQLMALDWECIRWGLPQLDFTQFILHSSSPGRVVERMQHYSELMRQRLSFHSGTQLNQHNWQLGLDAAIAYHLINRGPLLAVMAKFFMPDTCNIGLWMYRNAALVLHKKNY